MSSLSELEQFPPGTRLRREAYGASVAEGFFTKAADGTWSRDDGAVFEARKLRRPLADRTLYVVEPGSGSRGVARAAHLTPLVAELSCRPTRGLVGSTLYIVRVGPSVSGSSETSWGSAVASALLDAPKAPRGPEVVEAVLRAVEENAFVFSNQDDFGDALGGIHDRMHDMDAAALRRFEDWYEDETGMTFGDI